MLLLVAVTAFVALISHCVCQNSCGTDQNPYCKGNSVFEQICCPYPNVCYWQNRDGTPGCCPAGQVCDGSSPYSPSTPTLGPTVRTSTITPSTITITPTPTTTAGGGGGGVIIITTNPNGPSVITTQPQTTLTGACQGGPCSTVTSVIGGVYSTVTSGAGGVYSTVTSEVGGAFSTVTSGAASVYSSISGVLVGQPSTAPRSAVLSIVLLTTVSVLAVVWSTFS